MASSANMVTSWLGYYTIIDFWVDRHGVILTRKKSTLIEAIAEVNIDFFLVNITPCLSTQRSIIVLLYKYHTMSIHLNVRGSIIVLLIYYINIYIITSFIVVHTNAWLLFKLHFTRVHIYMKKTSLIYSIIIKCHYNNVTLIFVNHFKTTKYLKIESIERNKHSIC